MNKPKRDVEGIWVPIEIWTHPDLTPFEKMLLAEINSFDSGEGCFATSPTIVEQMQCSVSHLDNTISKLIKSKWVFRLKSEYRRCIRTCFSRHNRPTVKSREPTVESRMSLLQKVDRGLNKENTTRGAKTRPRAETPFGLSLNGTHNANGNGSAQIHPNVIKFAQWSQKRGYHKIDDRVMQGNHREGWSRPTLLKWDKLHQKLLQFEKSENTVAGIISWMMRHFDEPYTPQARTFPEFYRKYDSIKSARCRSIQEEGGYSGSRESSITVVRLGKAR